MNSPHPELHEILQRLYARQTFGIKLGLEPTRRLLDRIGSPEQGMRIIHVAGTNGKGSVCAMIASILGAAGLRVGLYSSPHLVDFRERMRIDGVPISEERLADYAREIMPLIEEIGCTFFEGTTAIALRYFADEEVDCVVLETGMGGRLDATNVVTPLLSIITSISLDHTRHLGESYEEIAVEKAGIIKSGVPAIVGPMRPRLRTIFSRRAEEEGTGVAFVEDEIRALHHETTLHGTIASFITPQRELEQIRLDLPGLHQIENGRLAIAAVERLGMLAEITTGAIVEGLGSVRDRTGIAGRFQALEGRPTIVLDVAHNEDGVRVLVDLLERTVPAGRPVDALFGAVREKSTAEVMKRIAPHVRKLWGVSADSPRSLPSDEIVHESRRAGIETVDAGTVAEGVRRGLEECDPEGVFLIFGSFFVVGEAIEALRERGLFPEEPTSAEAVAAAAVGVAAEGSGEYRAAPTAEQGRSRGSKKKGRNGEIPHRSVKEWAPQEQPRERLRQHGAAALSDAELLAILLRTGTRSRDVVSVARDLLHAFNDGVTGDCLIDIVGRDLRELEQVNGIGPVKAVTLAAAFELGNRVVARTFAERPLIGNPENIARYFIPRLRAIRKEEFHVILLNTAGEIIRDERVSEGNLNSSIATPREIFRTAIVESAASIIGLHNHPSGNPEPSSEDIAVTRQLVDAGRVLGIPLRDHIIIAGEKYTSLAERGYI